MKTDYEIRVQMNKNIETVLNFYNQIKENQEEDDNFNGDNVSIRAVSKIYEKSIEAHIFTSSMLGLSPENNFRDEITLTPMKKIEQKNIKLEKNALTMFHSKNGLTRLSIELIFLQDAVKSLNIDSLSFDELYFTTSGKISDGVQEFKPLKLLKKFVDNEAVLRVRNERVINSYTKNNDSTFEVLNSLDFLSHYDNLINQLKLDDFFLSEDKPVNVMISTNPIDFLSIGNTRKKSCLLPTGCYAAGSIVHALSGFTFIIAYDYNKENLYKNGRQVCFLNSSGGFCCQKNYGNISETLETMAREYIQGKISKFLGLENIWTIERGLNFSGCNSQNISGNSPVYIDSDSSVYSYIKSNEHKFNINDFNFIEEIICLSCGEWFNPSNTEKLFCPDCDEEREKIIGSCHHCEDDITEDEESHYDDWDNLLCQYCWENNTINVLDSRGNEIIVDSHDIRNNDDYVSISDGGNVDYCHIEYTFFCEKCNNYYSNDYDYEIKDDEYYCRECFDEIEEEEEEEREEEESKTE